MQGSGENAPEPQDGENASEHREEKGPDQDPDGKQSFVSVFVKG